MTLVIKKQLQQLAHRRIVLDDQDVYRRTTRSPASRPVPAPGRPRLGPPQRHLDGEDRARAQTGADIDLVAEQVGKALHDGETQAEALAALARGIVELMEFFEDRLELQFRNAGAGVPDLDAELVAAPSAAEQDLAVAGIFHRIRQQIADDLLEQPRIAAHSQAARDHAPVEAIGRCVIRELGPQLVEQALDRKICDRRGDDSRFELVDVEQLVQHARHSAHRVVEPAHELERCLVVNALLQHPLQQGDGLQGLPQIMTGGGQKARLSQVGPFRLRLGGLQRLALAPGLGDVVDRHQDLPPRRGLLSQHPRAHQERPPSHAWQIEIDLMIVDGGAFRLDGGQKVAQRGYIKMSAGTREVSSDDLRGLD